MKLLINFYNNKYYLGENNTDIIKQIPFIKFNYDKRIIEINDKEDTISFSKEYTDNELIIEFSNRAIELLKRNGYSLWKPV
jgi:hypothetical protein